MTESRRVVWRYYAYRVTNSYGFYLPVSVLFLTEVRGFGLDVVGLVNAGYLLALLAAEVPTGYLGDRIGRRASLAVANAVVAFSIAAYVFVRTPAGYLLLYVLWATGTAFRSGTADAWLYELLESRGEADEYARVSGRATTLELVTSAATALAAGVLVTVDWTLPFAANAALSALGVPILLALPAAGDEADGDGADGDDADDAFTVREAVRTLRVQAGRPEVRWFVAYAAIFYGLFQVTRSFEQPAATAVGVPAAGLGVLYAGFKLVSAGAASTAGWLEESLGVRAVFALYAPVVGVAYAGVALAPVLVVPVLFLNRGLTTVTKPIRNQYLNDRLGDVGRATALSGASMVLSLAGAGANLVGGPVAAATGPIRFVAGAGVALAGAAAVLWLATSPVRSSGESASVDAGATVASD